MVMFNIKLCYYYYKLSNFALKKLMETHSEFRTISKIIRMAFGWKTTQKVSYM